MTRDRTTSTGDELAPRDDEAPSIAVGLFFLALVVLSLLLAVRL